MLRAADPGNFDVGHLPAYILSVNQSFGRAQSAQVAAGVSDTRALQNPQNPSGPRSLGQYYCGVLPWAAGWDPSFVMDVYMQPTQEGVQAYQIALYLVDFDREGRKETVVMFDRWTLQQIAPVQYVTGYGDGVWLVWRYNRSVRFRFNYVRGKNQVVSAVMFDPASDSP